MKIIFEKHRSKRKLPVNFNVDDKILFEQEFERTIANTHLVRIKNAFVTREIIVKYLLNLRKYLSYTLVYPDISGFILLKRILLFRKGFEKINRGVWIIDNWSAGHFHWLTDALPRLIASKREITNFPILLPREFEQILYVTQSLELLGEKIAYYNIHKPLKVSDLLIASHTSDTGNYNKEVINELRNKFLGIYPEKGNRKIYISRLKAPKRKILNETEVIQVLNLFGYEIHYFEDYTFEKQVEIMSQAISLVGIHGSGLTNMLFMREGGKVLELRNQHDSQNNCFFSLASELNHEYYYQINKGNTTDIKTVDITVDVKQFENILESIERS